MNDDWYCVRCIFDWGRSPDNAGSTTYEERLILVRATSDEEAIRKAELEAEEYATDEISYTGFAQSYRLLEESAEGGFRNGSEVYSLLRDSALSPGAYIDAFFDTGFEKQADF